MKSPQVTDLDSAALAHALRLSRIARTQQERLWKLTEEVGAEREAWHVQQEQGKGGGRMIDERNPLLQALREQLDADHQQMLRCQRGQHDMLATASPGVVICRVCRTLGVCLWCGLTLPHGACITVCAKHVGAVHWRAKQHRRRTIEAQTIYPQEASHEPE